MIVLLSRSFIPLWDVGRFKCAEVAAEYFDVMGGSLSINIAMQSLQGCPFCVFNFWTVVGIIFGISDRIALGIAISKRLWRLMNVSICRRPPADVGLMGPI